MRRTADWLRHPVVVALLMAALGGAWWLVTEVTLPRRDFTWMHGDVRNIRQERGE